MQSGSRKSTGFVARKSWFKTMADDKASVKPGASDGKQPKKTSKKSTSKRRAVNTPKDFRLVDSQKAETVIPKVIPIQERTVIGQEASSHSSPKSVSTVRKNVQELLNRSSKTKSVEFSENVRSEADGSEDGSVPDAETEELSKLRCTSECTEVVAEREKRRRQRCADYPGLAFGSSIFSSDTLMKFSVIRNELHNILNSQLKRVSTNFTGVCEILMLYLTGSS